MAIGDKLRELREINQIERPDVARALGLPYTTYTNYETNQREPKQSQLLLMADYFGVSTDYLLGREATKASPANLKRSPIRIRVLGRVPAGLPIEAIEEVLDWEDLDPRGYTPSGQFFGLRVMGDSMYPEYLDGDTIIIEQSSTAETGQDVVAYVNGYDATLKKFIRYENGSIELRPINPNYPTKIFTATEAEEIPVQILGFVRELRRKK